MLYNDKIEIHYNNPTTKGPDESQGFLFYSGKGKIVSEIQNKKPLIKDNNRNVSAIKGKTKSLNERIFPMVQFRLEVVRMTGLALQRARNTV